MTPRHIVRFMALQASCAAAGGTCWAAGPYCGGGWDVGVVETMAEVGRLWDSLGKGVKDVVPSTSWPTVSGDTLEALGYVFACTGRSRVYEYVHVMRAQAGRISLPPPADGARLSYPVPVTAGIRVRDFCQDATGVRFSLEGDISEVDTIIRLRRENNPNAPVSIWINDSDKRILYSPGWKYQMLRASYTTHVEHLEQYACYENDSHTAAEAGRRLDTFFNGDEIELYGVLRPDGGKANILIDDICVAHIDTRAPEHKARALLFTSGNLHGGLHTFSVVTTGDGPFEFDALRAWGV